MRLNLHQSHGAQKAMRVWVRRYDYTRPLAGIATDQYSTLTISRIVRFD
jgi:hypothetical protein